MRRQKGFTLIEMVIVIILAGILASIALPRFAALQVDARVAKAQALYGAVASAASMVRSAAAATGAAAGGTVQVEGGTITLFNYYPNPRNIGILRAVALETAAERTANGVTVVPNNPGAAATTVDIQVNGATTMAACQVRYVRAAALGAAPTITLTTTGC